MVLSSNMFAYIVGINNYKYSHPVQLPNLTGAVNDARDMYDFLTRTVRVPEQNIVCLIDSQATRQAILNTFISHLINNRNIKKGDPILFFFAGHGARVDAPPEWSQDNKLECLCAHDTFCQANYRREMEKIDVIPDRTVNSLLRQLAHKKGNNITVIFDCCHAGSMTRKSEGDPPRFCTNPLPISASIDREFLSVEGEASRAGHPNKPDELYGAWGSHVLLAACLENELASSIRVNSVTRGAFTYFLLDNLRDMTESRITYVQLIQGLRERINQLEDDNIPTPRCIGVHRERFIFSTEAFDVNPAEFLVSLEDNRIKVNAGTMHGVMKGSELLLKHLRSDHEVGIMNVQSASADQAFLTWRRGDTPFQIPNRGRALLLSGLSVYADAGLLRFLRTPSRSFYLVSSPRDSDVALSSGEERGEVVFRRQDPLIGGLAKKEVSHRICPNDLPLILASIAHFNYHLRRTKSGSFLKKIEASGSRGDLIRKVTMHLLPLALQPQDLFHNYQARIRNDEQRYRIEIRNYSSKNLFAYLFYFDPSEYIIECWYEPHSSEIPPLNAMRRGEPGFFSVGYGPGGGDPLTFFLPPNELSDTSFLKLFVSEEFVDMKHIEQVSPFHDLFAPRKGLDDQQWGTLLASITVEI